MKENKTLLNILSVTLGVRLFSLLIIAPFFSVFAMGLKGGSPSLTGMALGIFGLTQAALQIPFGILADKVGYKKMMMVGLIMLIVGLVIAAFSEKITTLVFSRALQGSGAIVTVGYSWIASITDGEERNKALTRLSSVIAFSTMMSYVIGALVHIFLDVNHMFLFSAVLVLMCLIMVIFGTHPVDAKLRISRAKQNNVQSHSQSVFSLENILKSSLLTINNLLMMAFFFIFPLMLKNHLAGNQSWIILVPAIILSIISLNLFSRITFKGYDVYILILLLLFEGAGFWLIYLNTIASLSAGTVLLMSGFFSVSTIVPIILNKNMDKSQMGKGNGVMVSFQYFGSFLGAMVTGIFWQSSMQHAFLFLATVVVVGICLVFIQRKKLT